MFAAAKNLGDETGGMGDLLKRLRAREKARHGLQAKKDLDSSGLPIMTAAAIRQVAIDDEGYETPELNDRLYLHYKGFRKIQNLEPYTSLKALWLGGNGLSEIQGISHLSQLRCLYLERNLISTIKGLEGLDNLVQLDLSQNCIENTLGLSCLPALHTLNMSKNALGDADSVSPLSGCPSLTNLDVTANRLAGPGVLDVLSSVKGLVSLSLSGNPILAETAHFRKTVITASPKLRYLDRPVFQAERVAAAAWTVGGVEAEREARTRYQEEKRNEDRRQMQVFRDWQAEMRQKKLAEIESRAAAGLGPVEPSPEQVRRDEERAAKAKADANEDRRLINEVGLCKIADAFYASEGKSESRRDIMDTLVGGGTIDGNKNPEKSVSGGVVPGNGIGSHAGLVEGEGVGEEEVEESDLPAQPLTAPESCGTTADGATAGEGPADAAPPGGAGDGRSDCEEKEGSAGRENDEASGQDAKNTGDSNAPVTTSTNTSGGPSGAPATTSASDSARAVGRGSDEGEWGEQKHQHAGDEKSGEDDGEQEQGDEEKGGDRAEGDAGDRAGEEEESSGEAEEKRGKDSSEEDEERVRRVRVAQSLAMYRAQLAAERRLAEANHSIAEEKAGGGDAAAAARGAEVGGSPPRRGDKAGRTFQRRLEEASAEAYAESAAAPQIAAATGVTRAEEWGENNGLSCGVAVAGGIGRESTEAMKGVDRQPTGGGGDGVHGGWTEWEDGRLKRLVRECVFDFDLVAARLSSPAAAVDGDGASRGFTAEECRVRFAQLDGEEVSTDDEEGEADERNYHGATAVSTAVPGVLENAGLSFADLERKARNMKSRFLEPPKELPSIADDHDDDDDDDDDDDGDAGLGGGDATLEFETLASANRGDSGNLKCEDADHCDNEPELIVVSSPAAAAATKGGGCGGTFNGCNPDGGREESDSDGDDDEVLTRAQIKSRVTGGGAQGGQSGSKAAPGGRGEA